MKILFNKDAPETGELQGVLGFTDAGIKTEKIWPYLRSASREIYNIIGKTNYEIAELVFENSGDGDEEHKDLYELVRYAVALDAFRNYAPLNDVHFTNNGRLFRRDDHEVGAFEWQIVRSDAAMERSYYKAVDEIISFIVNAELLEPSDYMLDFSGLYVPDLKTFERFVNIGGSHLLYYKLAPSLRLCEQREIINRMGDKFMEYKAEKLKSAYITNLVQNICVYFAMADGIQKLSVQLFPEGLMKPEMFQKKAATGYDKETASLYYRNEMASLLKTLETEIRKLSPVYTSPPQINFGETDGFVSM